MLRQTLLLTGLAALAIPATVAHADTTTTYTLTEQTWSCKSDCGPYGTITVDEAANGLSATVTVNLSDPGDNIFFNQGGPVADGDALEFNLPVGTNNASEFTITPITSGFEADYPPANSTLYGSFSYGVTCDYAGGACKTDTETDVSSLEFTITSNGATPINFTDTGNVLFSAAVTDQKIPDPTGDVAVVTPEPSSLMLLGTGLIGFVGTLRRRQKA